MALLSKSSVYGIRATLYIAAQSGTGYVSTRAMASDLNISFHFLTKILKKLTQENLLHSSRGHKGGVRLAQEANQITLMEILTAIEGKDLLESCILGLSNCGNDAPCPLHDKWVIQRKQMESMFSDTTLDQFQDGLRTSAFRINPSGHILIAGN